MAEPETAAPVAVGIDGGKSQLRLQVAGELEPVVVDGVTHGAALTERLRDAVADAWTLAGSGAPVARAVAGMTAVPGTRDELQLLVDGIAADLGAQEVVIVNDSVTAHAAAFDGQPGMVLSVGTGVAGLTLDASGGLHAVSGAGFLLGDEGGAFWIGRAGLAAALAAHDGRGQETSLLSAAVAHYDVAADDLAVHVHTQPEPAAAVAGFAPHVLSAADQGDAVAEEISGRAVDELVRCVLAGTSGPSPVTELALCGRALRHDSALRRRLVRALAGSAAHLHLLDTEVQPVVGACGLAERGLGPYEPLVQASSTHRRDGRPVGARAAQRYLDLAGEVLAEASRAEVRVIDALAQQIADRLRAGGMLHTFGTGHSHLLAEEIFYRAGGLARVDPLLPDELMLHVSASGSTELERRAGLAAELLDDHPITEQDVLVVASNSGGNRVAVELAQLARRRGALVVALTNLRHATSPRARASEGPRLHEVADVVLDNHGVEGDVALSLPGLDRRIGPTSTVVGAALLQALVAGVIEQLVAGGCDPEVFASSNTAGGDARNAALLDRYRDRVTSL